MKEGRFNYTITIESVGWPAGKDQKATFTYVVNGQPLTGTTSVGANGMRSANLTYRLSGSDGHEWEASATLFQNTAGKWVLSGPTNIPLNTNPVLVAWWVAVKR